MSTKIEKYINVDTYYINMFVEIRKQGKKNKYYLVHSIRVGDKVKRITRYLGSDLSQKRLERLKERAKVLILDQLKGSIFEFELSDDEIKAYSKYDNQIKIAHLQTLDWERFTEEFTYNTNAIEGSTVNLDEVKGLIEGRDKPESPDQIEAINVAGTVEYIKNTREDLSIDLIKKLHYICFKGAKAFAGKLREVEVVIKDSHGNIVHRGAPAKQVPSLLAELVKWYAKHRKKYPALFLSAIVHNQFENIHPFQDGNGRVGRLLLNYVLLKHRSPPINIRLKDRMSYYKALQSFQKTENIRPTLRFLLSQYKKQHY